MIAFSFDPHSPFPLLISQGGLKYFDPELVDSFVENKNSDIKVICSDLHIFCHNVSVQDKG
jgi:hypothetical protein